MKVVAVLMETLTKVTAGAKLFMCLNSRWCVVVHLYKKIFAAPRYSKLINFNYTDGDCTGFSPWGRQLEVNVACLMALNSICQFLWPK